jgi:hypothetical protein
VALTRCPGCGGQITPHTTTCQWCGHSIAASVFVQVIIAVLLLGGVATFTGLLPWPKFLPHLSFLTGAVPSIPPPPPPAEGTQRDAESDMITRAFEATSEAAADQRSVSKAQPRKQTSRRGCVHGDSTRLRSLAQQYQDWDASVLNLVACGQIRTGFTAEQARAALGAPGRVEQGAGQEVWIYDRMKVVIADGRVSSVRR